MLRLTLTALGKRLPRMSQGYARNLASHEIVTFYLELGPIVTEINKIRTELAHVKVEEGLSLEQWL